MLPVAGQCKSFENGEFLILLSLKATLWSELTLFILGESNDSNSDFDLEQTIRFRAWTCELVFHYSCLRRFIVEMKHK